MTSLHEHSTGQELIFAGDLSGVTFRLNSVELHNNDVEEKPDVPDADSVHGNWLDVETDRGRRFVSAPGELIDELQRLDAAAGDLFEVTRCVKSGPKQTDPYEVNVEKLEEEQERL